MRLTVPHEGEEGRSAYPYPYLIGLRFCHAEWILGATAAKIRDRFCLAPGRESTNLPHITLFGPFHLHQESSEKDLYRAIQTAAGGKRWLSFRVDGWERKRGDHGAVIAVRILPGPGLVAFRTALFSSIEEHVIPDPEANRTHEEFWYHSTMVLNVSEERCREIWKTLIDDGRSGGVLQDEEECPDLIRSLHFPLDGFRVTLLKHNIIRGEYDLATGNVLRRNQTFLPSAWQESLKAYRQERGFGPLAPRQKRTSEIHLIADTHFGHANIIRYCARPFHPLRVEEMDETLIRNWNAIVDTKDRVYFLGDLCYGLTSGSPAEYLAELNGKVTVTRGNHDDAVSGTIDKTTITGNGIRFLLVHDPDPWVGAFDGWVIHGHHHNNDLVTYPFINFERRTVNVSVEVTGYRPLPLREIATLIRTRSGDEGPLLIRPLPSSEDAPPVAPQPL